MTENQKKEISQLWLEQQAKLYALCSSRLNDRPEDVDEVISETFLALCKKVNESGFPEYTMAWIYGTMNNIIMQKYRHFYKEKEKTVILPDYEEIKLPYPYSFEKRVEDQELIEEIANELDQKLKDEEKLFYKLVFTQDVSYDEVARLLNSNVRAVKQKKYRLYYKIQKIGNLIRTNF